MLRRLHKDKNAPSAPLSPRHSPRQMSPRTSLSARHIERGHQLAASLQQNSSVYGHVHANSEVVSLLNENAALESKNQKLAQQIEDLENVHRRLWERGRHPASPTSKGLRTFATEAQQQLERHHERHHGATTINRLLGIETTPNDQLSTATNAKHQDFFQQTQTKKEEGQIGKIQKNQNILSQASHPHHQRHRP